MNNVDYVVSTEKGDIFIEKNSKRITNTIVDQARIKSRGAHHAKCIRILSAI